MLLSTKWRLAEGLASVVILLGGAGSGTYLAGADVAATQPASGQARAATATTAESQPQEWRATVPPAAPCWRG
jgi:hypothetical protein